MSFTHHHLYIASTSHRLNIRTANNSDHIALCRLLEQLHPDDPDGQESISREIFEEIISSRHFDLLVAENGKMLVGTCYLNVIPNLTRSSAPYAVIENVVVDTAHRKQGIGQLLVKSAISQAFSQGCYKVMLMTGGNADTQRFYASCGMESGSKTAFITRA